MLTLLVITLVVLTAAVEAGVALAYVTRPGVTLALTAILDPGDEVIIPQPCFVSYVPETVFAGGVPVVIETVSTWMASTPLPFHHAP